MDYLDEKSDLINGLSFPESRFLSAGECVSKCSVARPQGSVLKCRFLGTTPDPLSRFCGDGIQAFQEILVQNSVRVTGLMKWHSEPVVRCSTKQSSDIQASTPPTAKPPGGLVGQNPLEWREHWPGIRILDAHIPFFFWGCQTLTVWPPCT